MKTRIQHIIFLNLILLLFTACVSEFTAKLPDGNEDILVVEGDILENTQVTILLSQTIPLHASGKPPYVQGSVVLVGSDGYRSEPAAFMGDGKHLLWVGELNENTEYSLEIETLGQKYVSKPQIPLKTPPIAEINFSQPVYQGDVIIRISTHEEEGERRYYMWNYKEDWEYNAPYYVTDFYDPDLRVMTKINPDPYYYCWNHRSGTEILVGSTESYIENRIINQPLIKIDSDNQRLALLYSIRVTQMSITKAAYEYFSNRAKMSEEMGGLFTPQPTEMSGNIYCTTDKSQKVIGFINITKNTVEDQLYISASDISRGNTFRCAPLSAEYVKDMLNPGPNAYHDFYISGYWPLDTDDLIPTLENTKRWVEKGCIDCTLSGGTKQKPPFWPNNHE